MKCAVHAEVDATGYCRNCGKALCAECTRDVRGVLYCENCLAAMVAQPPATAGSYANPRKAFWLGLVPGLGAVYNGEYTKALVHVVIFIALVTAQSSEISASAHTALGLSIAAFIAYMAIDAHRVAKEKQAGQAAADPLGQWSKGRPIGPLILIGLGVIFLLEQFDIHVFSRVFEFWPVLLIALGLLMLRNEMGRSSESK